MLPPTTPIFGRVKSRRTVDYLFRDGHHAIVAYTGQADIKASIMITACSLVVTITVAVLARGDSSAALIASACFAVIALLLAILAVLPKHRKGDKEAPDPGRVLFFAQYSGMSKEEYMRELARICEQDATVYEALASQLYEHGCYLDRQKFRYLRLSYAVFFTGVSVGLVVQLIDSALVS